MFVRVKTRPNTEKKAVQIIKSVREKDKVNQKVVYTVGYAFDDEKIEQLRDLGEYIKVQLQKKDRASLFDSEYLAKEAIKARKKKETQNKEGNLIVDIRRLREKTRLIRGIHQVYGRVFKQLGFDKILTKRHTAASKLLFHTVMARLACPLSKRASVNMLAQDFGVTINLDKVYRMMDRLDEKVIQKVQNMAYQSTRTLLGNKINVLFYDCTTLYFESFSPDDLKQNGYSKDGKFNQPQVLLALLITTSGLPIGYEVFPGATFEGHTLRPILEKIKSKYDLEKVIFVADSGLLSKDNREFLEQSNFHYILGARVKNLSKSLKKSVLDSISKYDPQNEETLTEIDHSGQRLIVRYSPKRARKDKHDREKAIENLKKVLAKKKRPKAFLNNYGYKKYIEIEGETIVKINEEKVQKAAQWDGVCGVITNLKSLEKEKVVNHYRNLWQIESCFRIQKHDLKIRPIFHWTPRRVRAHIALCFIAFCCQQYLHYILKLQDISLSIEEIRKALVHVQLSVLEHRQTKCRYGIPSSINKEAKSIYKATGIKYSSIPFLISKNQNNIM